MAKLRLHQYRRGKPCHFCGRPGPSTAEHAPPRTFFEGTPCTSITVPACPDHNSEKAGADRAIKTALLRGMDQLIVSGIKQDVPDALRRSIESMQDKYRQANGLVTMQPLIADAPEGLGIRFPFLHRDAKIGSWISMLTSALVWSVTGTHASGSDWEALWSWSPSYYPSRRNRPLSLESCLQAMDRIVYTWRNLDQAGTWRPGWQPYPEPFPATLYRFDVCFEASHGAPTVMFRHQFFGSHLYFARFTTSEDTASIMDQYLKAETDRLQADGITLSQVPHPPHRYSRSWPRA